MGRVIGVARWRVVWSGVGEDGERDAGSHRESGWHGRGSHRGWGWGWPNGGMWMREAMRNVDEGGRGHSP